MGNGMLSQEEIDALLTGTLEPTPFVEELTEMERDALGEIANISMGTAATTLSQLLNKKVEITTHKVDITTSQQIREDYPVPSIIVDVEYRVGLEGTNLLILSQRDGAVIVNLMMGGDGSNPSEILSEMEISGISEAMNQMMGSAATSMSAMFHSKVDITPPQLVLNDLSEPLDVIHQYLNDYENLIRISFRMVVEDVIDSVLVQVLPIDVGKKMVEKLIGSSSQHLNSVVNEPVPPLSFEQKSEPMLNFSPEMSNTRGRGDYPPAAPLGFGSTQVQPAQFAPLHSTGSVAQPDNLELIMDVPLQVSVELGKAKKTIKEILELGPGSVVELDKLAGEPVDMMVNGKLIAKCEVVVINETFGIRITDIIHPTERIKTLK